MQNPFTTTRSAVRRTETSAVLAAPPRAQSAGNRPAPDEWGGSPLARGRYITWRAPGEADARLDHPAAAVAACDQLLAEARERGVPATAWRVQQLQALRARLAARSDRRLGRLPTTG